MQTVIEYVLPNVALFGGIYLLAKYVENATWHFIENYEETQAQLAEFLKKFKL